MGFCRSPHQLCVACAPDLWLDDSRKPERLHLRWRCIWPRIQKASLLRRPVHPAVLHGVDMRDLAATLCRNGPSVPRAKSSAQDLLSELLSSCLVLQEDWEALAQEKRHTLLACDDPDTLINLLVDYGLLTDYQA